MVQLMRMSNGLKYILLLGMCTVQLFGQSDAMTLHILYTQNNNGELENCHCPSNPLGGFEKRSTFLQKWMLEHPNTILLDTGDFLSFEGNPDSDFKVVKLMEQMHYFAVNIGDQELSNGSLFFHNYLAGSKLPLLSTNLMVDANEKRKYQRFLSFTMQGVKVAISGVLDPKNVKYFAEANQDAKLWSVAPGKALKILHDSQPEVANADVHILMSNLGLDHDQALSREIPFIDVILGGHSQHMLIEPIEEQNTIIVQSGKDGHYIGHLALDIQNKKVVSYRHEAIPMGSEIVDDPHIMEMIHDM